MAAPVERPSLRLHATGSFTPWWTRRPQRLPSREDIPLLFDEIGEGCPMNLSVFERLVLEEWYSLDDRLRTVRY